MAPRLKERYKSEIVPELMREFSYTTRCRCRASRRSTLNIGLGEARENARAVDSATADLATITGQKPVVTRPRSRSRTSSSARTCRSASTVTLRGERMYEFLDRLLNAALPRIRDFHGVPTKAFDGRGNYSLGVREQLIFPEIDYDKVDQIRGMQITIITTAQDRRGRQAAARAPGHAVREGSGHRRWRRYR